MFFYEPLVDAYEGADPGTRDNFEAMRPDLIRNWDQLKSQYDNYAHAFVWLKYSFYFKVFSEFRGRMEDYKQEKRIVFLEELKNQ